MTSLQDEIEKLEFIYRYKLINKQVAWKLKILSLHIRFLKFINKIKPNRRE